MTNWPDWKDEIAVVVASGPSAKRQPLKLLKGKAKVLAIKKSFELVPFADVVYGCDGPWWKSVLGLQTFGGLKLAYDTSVVDAGWGIQRVKIEDKTSDEVLFKEIGSVGAGGNSGFQALNLVMQFGAKRIILVGIDCSGTNGGEHWYGRNNWGMASNPTEDNYRRWRKVFAGAAKTAAERGIQIITTSDLTEMKCFPRMQLEEALNYFVRESAEA